MTARRSAPGRPKPTAAPSGGGEGAQRQARGPTVWLFDLDDTLHDASSASLPHLHVSMGQYIEQQLGLDTEAAAALRRQYFQRYGATLLGLIRHHGVRAHHFLHHTHLLPGLEQRVRGHAHDLAALARLRGRRVILTNAPAAYTARVMDVLGIAGLFERVISIEDMHMFGQLRPKPDARMLRRTAHRLGVPPARCVLVEDTLVHQKAARRVGMKTVWMQRWTRGALARAPRPGARTSITPAYVDRRVRRLSDLLRRPG